MSGGKYRVAIVGASVAGSRLASILAGRGLEIRLFDFRVPWEKPCGGGITPKLFDEFPDLSDLDLDGRDHNHGEFIFPDGTRVSLHYSKPVHIVSRKRLGVELLKKATQAGAEFIKEKVRAIESSFDEVTLRTAGGEWKADFVVGADGANSIVRRTFAKGFERNDMNITCTTLLPIEVDMPVILKFFKDVHGYAWIFPRKGATSIGIDIKQEGSEYKESADLLSSFVREEWSRAGLPDPDLGNFRAWKLPSLRPEAFVDPPLCGKSWALIGDASGAVDPITGEGIYYAIKTAHFLAEAIDRDDLSYYAGSWKQMAEEHIGWASSRAQAFYRTRNLKLLALALEFSPGCMKLTEDVWCGLEQYNTLKKRVLREMPSYIGQALWYGLTSRRGAKVPVK